MVVNKTFKAYVQRLSEKHKEENLEDYIGGKISSSERHILMRKCILLVQFIYLVSLQV